MANVELGAQSYDQTCTLDGKPSVALSVYQLPGSNALQVARRVKNSMTELKERFPARHRLRDRLRHHAVHQRVHQRGVRDAARRRHPGGRRRAGVLAELAVGADSARSPCPWPIIGTFAVMAAMGFSLNNLTLFGLVLAIGIVVDDAIVVVEAVEHHIEHGMTPHDATIKAMEQVSGPVMAIGLVLSAVFVPCAFITGITGQFFRQFALTIAVSTIISAFNSLTLSPALCGAAAASRARRAHSRRCRGCVFAADRRLAGPQTSACIGPDRRWRLLHLQPSEPALPGRPAPVGPDRRRRWRRLSLAAAGAADQLLAGLVVPPVQPRLRRTTTRLHADGVRPAAAVSVVVLLVYGGLLFLTWFGFTHTPTGFIPPQDKGYLLVNVQLPDAASVARTQEVVQRIEEIALQDARASRHTVAISGQSILLNANAPNFGALYLMLDDFDDRSGPACRPTRSPRRCRNELADKRPEAIVNIFGAPPVEGLGTAGGFKIIVEDRGDNGLVALQETADDAWSKRGEGDDRGLQGLFTSFRADTPWLELVIDRAQAKDRGVSIDDVRDDAGVDLGPYYINDFNRSAAPGRSTSRPSKLPPAGSEDIKQLKVRNSQGDDGAAGGLRRRARSTSGPVLVMRYNMYPAAAVNADAGAGDQFRPGHRPLWTAAASEDLPPTMRPEWTELALLQLQTGNTAMCVFVLAVVLVFLVLAAQYESWSLPLAVILVVPMCLLCSHRRRVDGA